MVDRGEENQELSTTKKSTKRNAQNAMSLKSLTDFME